ncbi:MAG: S-layer protein [uncultured bacterium]|nr:MAG: S-layer protein [uncultured bacterium]
MRKRINIFVIALMLLGTTTISAVAKDFSDIDYTHWAYQAVQALAENEVVVGYPDGTFQPDEPATRAEFATMVIKALRQEHAQPCEIFYFSDLAETHWAYSTIQKACAFDLIKGFPDETFKPEDNVSKAEAIAIMISAIDTDNITVAQAKEALKIYTDANQIPDWAIIPAGKSEKLNMTAHNPMTFSQFEPDKKITRAEVAVNLYNMKEQAKINPNKKLAPKKADGLVINEATVDGTVATIPAGTLIPVKLAAALYSQKNDAGELFTAETYVNLVTKENYLLIPKGSSVVGNVEQLTPARYFIRNAKMDLDSKHIKTSYTKRADFSGNVSFKEVKDGRFKAIIRFIIRGKKINLEEGELVQVELAHPVVIALTSTTILK